MPDLHRIATLGSVLLACLGTAAIAGRSSDHAGVVLLRITPGSVFETAKLQEGDLIVAWRRQGASRSRPVAEGPISSPFDWYTLEIQHGPLGPIEVDGFRQGLAFKALLPVGKWDSTIEPAALTADLMKVDKALLRLDYSQAAHGLEALARARPGISADLRCWIYTTAAEARGNARQSDRALADYQQALRYARRPAAQVALLTSLAGFHTRYEHFAKASVAYTRLCKLERSLAGEGLGLAKCWHSLGNLAIAQGDLSSANDYWRKSLALRTRIAPDSLEVAGGLTNLGNIYYATEKLDEAERLTKQAYDIQVRLAPLSSDIAATIMNLGNFAEERGDFRKALEFQAQALAIRSKVHPGSADVAASYNNLANLHFFLRDLTSAEDNYQQAFDIASRWAPDSLDVAGYSLGLANVYVRQQQLDAAMTELLRAVRIQEAKLHSEDRYPLAATYEGLGNVAYLQQSYPRAKHYFLKALRSVRPWRPLGASDILNSLGDVELALKHPDKAKSFYQRAIDTLPGSEPASMAHVGLAQLAGSNKAFALARANYAAALEIARHLFPDSLEEADVLGALGLLEKDAGRLPEARAALERCVSLLARAVDLSARSHEIQTQVRAPFLKYYRALMEILVDQHEETAALRILEESRARSFLALLAERDIALGKDLPPEIEASQKRLRRDYQQIQTELLTLGSRKDSAKATLLARQLGSIKREIDESAARLRTISPKVASLHYPQPLDLAQLAGLLDERTILLAFSVGELKTIAFAISKRGLERTHIINISALDLGRTIDNFMTDLKNPSRWRKDQVIAAGGSIFELLVSPFQDLLARSDRIVLIPDEHLNMLAWSALVRRVADASPGSRSFQYLVEWKPIDIVRSGTVLGELMKRRKAVPESEITLSERFVGFGNPDYHGHLRLGQLPFSELEVRSIADLFPGEAVPFIEKDATKEHAKAVTAGTRYLHFATHATFDTKLPLNSAVILSTPPSGQERESDSQLQAWEVLEDLRLDADLVVLSSCQSAAGGEIAGEGLIGLERAFEYAGARSVIASLWKVTDATTAELMIDLYRELRAGKDKAEALRLAQLHLIKEPIPIKDASGQVHSFDASDPYYWSAFENFGDWK
jgi:CHAT domain-containing protein